MRLVGSARKETLVLVICLFLPGCAALGDVTGAVAGLVSGAITANPAIGIGVGVSVRAATNEAAKYVSRKRQQNEHDAIAAAVAETDVNETRVWAVDRRVTGDAHGEVRVIRIIQTSLALCKEALFSVVSGDGDTVRRLWFSTTACEEGGRWKWAAAEPAVDRWINLQ
jgi:hypothetical protein